MLWKSVPQQQKEKSKKRDKKQNDQETDKWAFKKEETK